MKPRLRKSRGSWYCGTPGYSLSFWTVAATPGEAYWMWRYSQSLKARYP